ncbi:probable proline--tRNA ligase, mitochondrial isoform X2 [Sipha flava]|uniref:Probable proline--tRNA ligase, mitochondrial n=1 Tax=Sipha flava TaxID=143950 RepID=A0A2S2Q7V4_9HEMI|nr:probable proline--tRNA ligase, mitochondrial isoform X2 [Sipha flava]
MKMNSLKNIFRPTMPMSKNILFKPDELISNSQKLMLELGLIRQSANGLYHLLPLAQRSLDKLICIINKNMMDIGAQKISMPVLIQSSLWKKSGRLSKNMEDLYIVKDRKNKEFLLSPTHEEVVTNLFSSDPKTYKQLPLMLYQIGTKFRDEIRPKLGIIRSREFLMKDLYSFDKDEVNAVDTYNKICQAYENIFKQIGVKFIKVEGSSGMMGGSQSHEFHYPSEVGDDTLLLCNNCGFGMNKEVSSDLIKCLKCSSTNIECTKAIEVGHTFLLGTFYSKALSAKYLDSDGTSKPPYMGSYGLGVSRIIGASVECLSTQEIIQWPKSLSPFTVCIIPAKEGSIEERISENNLFTLYNNLTEIFGEDIVVDDRTHMTIGKRFIEAKKLGFPFVIIVGKKVTESPSLYELYKSSTKKSEHFEFGSLIDILKKQCNQQNT